MLNTLKNESIVDKNLVLVDKETKICMTLFITKTTYYIYENYDLELVAKIIIQICHQKTIMIIL